MDNNHSRLMNHFDVLTCGSATVDVFAHTDDAIRKIRAHGSMNEYFVYPVGAKMMIRSMHSTTGGGGTNTAAAFSLLGLHTGYIGCLGNDPQAALIRHALSTYSVSFLGHTVEDCSGYSIILDSVSHDRTILTYKGANNFLTFSKVHVRDVKTKAFYCSSMVGRSFSAQLQLCAWAKKQGALVAYNPSLYQTKEGLEKLKPLLKITDVLIFNKDEAKSLVGSAEDRHIITRLQQHVPTVIITDGSHSIFACHNHEYYVVHPPKVKVVETTGAGDAFAAGVVAGLVQQKPFEQCLVQGLANSAGVISKIGAKDGLLSAKTMAKYIKSAKFAHCVERHGHLI